MLSERFQLRLLAAMRAAAERVGREQGTPLRGVPPLSAVEEAGESVRVILTFQRMPDEKSVEAGG